MNWKKILLYLAFSFSISWTVFIISKLLRVEYASTAGTIIVAGLYMPGPSLAAFIVQKLIYKGSFKEYGWGFTKQSIRWALITPIIFLAFLALAFSVVGLLGNSDIIPEFGQLNFSHESVESNLRNLLGNRLDTRAIKIPDASSLTLLFIFLLQAMAAGVSVNLPIMLGEELGWRGLMLKETQTLGFVRSNLLIGITWGVWHLPIIIAGHNYPHHSYTGILMMCIFTVAISPVFAYVRLKMKSIVGPCMLHGMINASGSILTLYVVHANELFSSIAGWAGVIAGLLLTTSIYVFDGSFIKSYSRI
ncbi:CPBP family intramembrane metalloprotease [Hymenobacter sp. BT664]|uniref:CPBP family intramembrane metalloprotease n=1 Tax=Hymenobacter montanus TaxID=2771359 RepID=A0A927BG99_9BACT|nr:CPBP family intramembrane glutamic endopeptidase [Hymenobacter montanus]MBD2769906.1 CPBP family intramembrane metalloprotease [Hymenobacter montanus]